MYCIVILCIFAPQFNNKMTNTMLNIRIDKGLKDKLQKMADKENRTLSNFILTELMKLVDTSKKKK